MLPWKKTFIFGSHVILDGKFAAPQRHRWPTFTKYTVIRHAAIDIVLNMSFLGRVGQRFADSHLIAP